MPDIVLSTLNAKYIHASFGLRYLYANLGELKEKSKIIEFHINQRPIDIVERIILAKPKIVGFGVYIWNAVQTLQVIKLLKKVNPNLLIVVGGPEVSFECDDQEIVKLSDYCITGEADFSFRELCQTLLAGRLPEKKLIHSPLPDLEKIVLPYEYYNEDDIAHRVVYVEASRGCPFTCEFCLSSLDLPVRQFPFAQFMDAIKTLLDRGLRQFKFVDRTFNLNIRVSKPILEFFLENFRPGLFLHFEMIPDRLPEALREVIVKFPKGALQFEVGIQSFNPEVNKLISRRNDFTKAAENFEFLRTQSGVHIHADLIAGLPGEPLESFGEGFDRLLKMQPQEIQVGILKRLRGTPIIRHDVEWQMVYSPEPPYEILSNRLIDFPTMQRISRFSRYWDLYANSGHFKSSLKLLWQNKESPFQEFMKFSDWLYCQVGQRHGIALQKLVFYLKEYLVTMQKYNSELVAQSIERDFLQANRKKESLPDPGEMALPSRQQRHLM